MKRIVTLGGGTGSFVLLSGLKKYPVRLSAIVSMADDGGSTGVLRDELGVLPPGDVRQCLVALSGSSQKMRELMNYRFEKGGLKGHNFGNLFLSALEKINSGFLEAVQEASRLLNVKGEVIPVTSDDITLCVKLKNGKVIKGQEQIETDEKIEKRGVEKFYLEPTGKAHPLAIKRLLEADLICLGPGSLYCSILPNLLVKGIPEAIRNSKGKVAFNCNLVNKTGHSENFDLDCYAQTINGYLGGERIDFVTFNSKKLPERLIKKYQDKEKRMIVRFNKNSYPKRSYKVLLADLVSEDKPRYSSADKIAKRRSFIRHDSDKLAKVLISLLDN